MLTGTYSATLIGIDAVAVEIEVHASGTGEGVSVSIVGLPDAAVRESKERIRSALYAAGLRHPEGFTLVNLAPGDIRKEGTAFDLPIALALASAAGAFPKETLADAMILGELALDSSVRAVKGVLPAALLAKQMPQIHTLIVPADNAREAATVLPHVRVFAVNSLTDAIRALAGELLPLSNNDGAVFLEPDWDGVPDFAEVKGQAAAKRALEIAAAGGHNVIFIGPPGSGKSMLAQRMPGILPPMTEEETLETSKIHSVLGLLPHDTPLLRKRPFRAPHHTVSDAGLIGGGTNPQPGEISLAHNGVLFLDELPEFKRSTLEVLRQPLENGEVSISRAAGSFIFPCRFLLIAAMNPCPCGHLGDRRHRCSCRSLQIQQYRAKISGPLLDRIDLHVNVEALSDDELVSTRPAESSASIRARCIAARDIQTRRYGRDSRVRCNAMMGPAQLTKYCTLEPQLQTMIRHAINEFGLSARAYDRILRVARTIADLAGSEAIRREHLFEAIGYRALDRKN